MPVRMRRWMRWTSLPADILQAAADRGSMISAGCPFYATLALHPAISMLISVYGLMLRPFTAERRLAVLSEMIPGSIFALIDVRVHYLVHQASNAPSLNLLVSFLLTFWTAVRQQVGPDRHRHRL